MDLAEKMAYDYFTSLGIKDIVHEPDGNVPPDLLFGNKIAVEVRRLNPNNLPTSSEQQQNHCGLSSARGTHRWP